MELSEQMLKEFKDLFDIEIELLEGKCIKLENGMYEIEIHVEGYKEQMFRDYMNMMMSIASDQISVKFMGKPIISN